MSVNSESRACEIFVAGNGGKIFAVEVGFDGTAVLTNSYDALDPTPWLANCGPTGLILIQKSKSDKLSSIRTAAVKSFASDVVVSADSKPLGGSDPVHGSVEPSKCRWAVVAHGADLRAMHMGPKDQNTVVVDVGSKCSQALWHSSLPGVLYATNLGSHKILRYSVNMEDDGFQATLKQELVLPEGSGPRRMALSHGGSAAYVINELSATVGIMSVDSATGELALRGCISSLPPGQGIAGITSAQILLSRDGRLLLASNRSDRGEDSIACFAVSGDGFTLTPLGWATPVTAATDMGLAVDSHAAAALLWVPRDMCLVEDRGSDRLLLAVANQAAESVSFFEVTAAASQALVQADCSLPGGHILRCRGFVQLPTGAQPTCVMQWR